MKNKSRSRTGSIIRSVFNLRLWTDWDRMRTFTLYLLRGIKKFFVPETTTDVETFDEAQKRLNLSEADLISRRKALYRTSLLMLVFALFFLGYAIYHFMLLQMLGGWLSLVVMLIALVLAFRYHFWYFQIKERKLGCSIQEWVRYIKG